MFKFNKSSTNQFSVKDMLEKAYFKRLNEMYRDGVEKNKIIKFDNEFYKRLENTFVSTIPVSIHIKHLKPNDKNGKCFERSLYMFMALSDVSLVRADCKDLEYKYGKESARHGWVEDELYVYDPSLLVMVDKKLYYQMFAPSNIDRITKDEYIKDEANKKMYNNIVNTKIEDYMPNGSKRNDLIVTIPLLLEFAQMQDNQELLNDLYNYLDKVKYDYSIISENVSKEFQKVFATKNIV